MVKNFNNLCLSILVVLAIGTCVARNVDATTLSFGAGSQAGPWNLDAANNTFTITGTLANPSVLNGSITESFVGANLLLTSPDVNNAVNIATLNGVSSYTGNTTIRSVDARAGFRIGLDNALPTGTVLTLQGANNGTGRPVWFDLNGHAQELAGILHAVRTDAAIVNGDAANDGALIINNNSNVTYQAYLGPNNAHPNITAAATGIPDGEGNNFSLTKEGTGTLTLTAANSYTGNTSINNGTLSIQNAYLDDLADVAIATGATFNLNFNGIDTIDELYFDGVGQQLGTWGAIGSGADFESNFFTGTGLLQVSTRVPEPTAFVLWAVIGVCLMGRSVVQRRRQPSQS